MGSTSFLGFSYPNLLLVFLNLFFFRDLYHIFLASVGGGWRTSSRDFAYFRVSYDILRSSSKRSSPFVLTTVVVLKQPSQSIHT